MTKTLKRQIDVLVAEKVMGYKLATAPSSNSEFPVKYRWEDADGNGLRTVTSGFFGWGWFHSPEAEGLPDFSTDSAADYSVLAFVREKWDANRAGEFANMLNEIWLSRLATETLDTPRSSRTFVWSQRLVLCCLYQPGDYSKAALMTLGVHP